MALLNGTHESEYASVPYYLMAGNMIIMYNTNNDKKWFVNNMGEDIWKYEYTRNVRQQFQGKYIHCSR